MKKLEIELTKSSPYVRFDPATGVLEIGGESYPENSHEFFGPVVQWIDSYLENPHESTTFRVTLSYMNTSSTKYMIDILDRLEGAYDSGRTVSVEWYCDAGNDRAVETVEELKEDFSMPFEVIQEEY